MFIKPLFLLLSIDLGLLAITLTIKFFLYPGILWIINKKSKRAKNKLEKTIEIKIEKDISKPNKLVLKE
ncbi:hypothetical protein [uncultured Thomasclavelia sp.]|uniref:hypothetical protein n=1 Tax=uncultured Thomasclavelia sp. TaxID=3025759 RepID=UPI0025FA39A5|nr:hypothetical protein [uncultured Thomasclavelia sp.]